MSRYGEAWGKLIAAVRNGASWSGGERNCCFLNVAGRRFIDVSSLSGVNFNDDGRAIAICDWDRDGDQDMWLRNRSAPRIRLMINNSSGARSVFVRLQGVESNRDGIGAVVELQGQSSPLIRSVRAGEMFLSQSSKWLHFGIGEGEDVGDFTVYWPGGKAENFHGAKAGGRYLLRQGEGTVGVVQQPGPGEKSGKENAIAGAQRQVGGIVLPVAVPFPRLSFRDPAAKGRLLTGNDGVTLLVVWDSASRESLLGLAALQKARGKMRSAGLRVLALAVNGVEEAGEAYEAIENCGFGWEWGFIGRDSLAALFRWQAALFDRHPDHDVPLSLLLNANGECVSIYRGSIMINEVLSDTRELIDIDPLTRWHLAPPMQGTWFTNPVDDGYIRRVVEEALEEVSK
jgi:hypothetical protein